MTPASPTIALSPHGALYLLPAQPAAPVAERIRAAFAQGDGHGLMQLGLAELDAELPPDLAYWRDFAGFYFSRLCALPGLAEMDAREAISLPPPRDELPGRAATAPPLVGGEYLNGEVLAGLWEVLHVAVQSAARDTAGSVQDFFARRGSAWNLVGRVCFHLAENKADEHAPFAFLATYSHRLSAKGKAQHLPLGKALQEYAGDKNKAQLLQLLLPVQKGTQKSRFLKALVDSGEIFHPLAWTPQDALAFLRDIPVFESSGVIVRVPDWWKSKKPPRPTVSVTVGGKQASMLGLASMLEFSVNLTLDGGRLTEKESRQILASTSGLALIRGKWVEIDREKLTEVLDHWKAVERAAAAGGISFIEGMRLLSGAAIGGGAADVMPGGAADWAEVTAGDGLSRLLEQLRDPDGKLSGQADPGDLLHATLRPYQQTGVRWLWFLNRLGLGGCLADDMGLGKTIQVIALLLLLQRERSKDQPPSLLVVPASLIGNWKSEIDRFAPSLRYRIAHPSAQPGAARDIETPTAAVLASTDVVITTYGYLGRLPWLAETTWHCIVIDEAQAIKNSGSRQTRAVKALKGRHRLALTGTPVENHLSDLWSLYDFLTPGLLGTGKDFERFVKGAEKDAGHGRYAALRNLVRPYLLRRLKTDKRIISDLPDKTELAAWCALSKTQAVLYSQAVEELATKIESADGIQRRGVVLSYLMRLKQICNHPSQWLADNRYQPADSGKFARLRELAEEIAARQEKVLVFTQFREMTDPLSRFLAEVFGQPGLVLHGGTAVKNRKELVDTFQDDRGAPFFVLSLKAGGTGLNLTAASHVIHFDRWWNPAVENQATDRAYRIGQKNNVLVHKFICRGTIEEKIDAMIAAKQSMSKEVLEGSHEAILTELSNDDLLQLVALDIRAATVDS
jgi:non-specific serine/threonine protein kinase